MAAATVRTQAKINLFLRVVGRERSGYHRLDTLFCRIALADTVTVRLTRASRTLDCSGPELPRAGLGTVAENLAWRAATAYADTARWPSGFEIDVEKHIPVSAGLGGGSADAGAVLRVLDALNARPLGDDALQRIARSLGADIPFLTQAHCSLAWGRERGDVWTALPPLAERECILALPATGVATAAAYGWLDEARGWKEEIPDARTTAEPLEPLGWRDVRRIAHNDFESVVFPRIPEIAGAWRYLSDVVERSDPTGFARMSGSGSAVFAILGSPGSSRGITLPPAPSGVRTLVTHTAERVESVQPID